MIILDTNVISEILRTAPNESVSARINAVLSMYRGTHAICDFSGETARFYAKVVAKRQRAGQPIAMADAQIAAICMERGAVCATRNVKDFQGTGVKLFNPWEEA